MMCENACCFFGHRTTEETEELKSKLINIIEELIVEKQVDSFLFGSKSGFDRLCLKIVSEIKEKYPHIKRIYVRAEYPHISESYREHLLEIYEEPVYPKRIINAGKASYIERNYEMIDKSYYCVVGYGEPYIPTTRKSGTKIALDYAIKKGKNIIGVL